MLLPPGWVEIRGRHLPGFALEPSLALARQYDGYWYLGSPYTKAPGGIDAAADAACRAAGWLVNCEIPVFSPIAHSHWIATRGGVDPLAHGLWMRMDRPLMAQALGLLVLGIAGWRDSIGLAEEIDRFGAAGKPIWFLDPAVIDGGQTS